MTPTGRLEPKPKLTTSVRVDLERISADLERISHPPRGTPRVRVIGAHLPSGAKAKDEAERLDLAVDGRSIDASGDRNHVAIMS